MASLYQKITDKWAIMLNVGWQNWEEFGKVAVTIRAKNTTELETDRNYKDTWHVALGTQYDLAKLWHLSAGVAYDSSPVADDDRTVDMPLDRQIRVGLGLQHDISEDVILGFAYTYMDGGKASVNQERGPLSGRVDGSYSTNIAQVFNVTLDWKF